MSSFLDRNVAYCALTWRQNYCRVHEVNLKSVHDEHKEKETGSKF